MRTDVRTYAGGDTTVERMALEAGALGYGAIVSVGGPPMTCGAVRVIPGVYVAAEKQNQALAAVRRAPEGAFVTVRLGEQGFNRAAAGFPGVHALSGVHRCRRNSFDHVAARTAAERGVAIELVLAPLVRERGGLRQAALRRYADVLVLQHAVRLSARARLGGAILPRSPGAPCGRTPSAGSSAWTRTVSRPRSRGSKP